MSEQTQTNIPATIPEPNYSGQDAASLNPIADAPITLGGISNAVERVKILDCCGGAGTIHATDCPHRPADQLPTNPIAPAASPDGSTPSASDFTVAADVSVVSTTAPAAANLPIDLSQPADPLGVTVDSAEALQTLIDEVVLETPAETLAKLLDALRSEFERTGMTKRPTSLTPHGHEAWEKSFGTATFTITFKPNCPKDILKLFEGASPKYEAPPFARAVAWTNEAGEPVISLNKGASDASKLSAGPTPVGVGDDSLSNPRVAGTDAAAGPAERGGPGADPVASGGAAVVPDVSVGNGDPQGGQGAAAQGGSGSTTAQSPA